MEARDSAYFPIIAVTGYRSHAVIRVELTGYFVRFGHPTRFCVFHLSKQKPMKSFFTRFSYDFSLKVLFLFIWILLLSSITSLQSYGRFLWATRYCDEYDFNNTVSQFNIVKQEDWPPGSTDTVCPRRTLMTQVQHWAKAAQTDQVTLRPWPCRSWRLWLMRVVVLHSYTKFEVRRPCRSEDMVHDVCQH